MDKGLITSIIVILVQVIVWGTYWAIFTNNTLYCMIFEREVYKLYHKILKLPDDKIKYKEKFMKSKHFLIPSMNLEIIWFGEGYISQGNIGIFTTKGKRECLASSYYRRGATLLKNKLQKIYDNRKTTTSIL